MMSFTLFVLSFSNSSSAYRHESPGTLDWCVVVDPSTESYTDDYRFDSSGAAATISWRFVETDETGSLSIEQKIAVTRGLNAWTEDKGRLPGTAIQFSKLPTITDFDLASEVNRPSDNIIDIIYLDNPQLVADLGLRGTGGLTRPIAEVIIADEYREFGPDGDLCAVFEGADIVIYPLTSPEFIHTKEPSEIAYSTSGSYFLGQNSLSQSMIHEVGHALGLSHHRNGDFPSIMNENYPAGGNFGDAAKDEEIYRIHKNEYAFLKAVFPDSGSSDGGDQGGDGVNVMLSKFVFEENDFGDEVLLYGWTDYLKEKRDEFEGVVRGGSLHPWEVCETACDPDSLDWWLVCPSTSPTDVWVSVMDLENSHTVTVTYALIKEQTDSCASGDVIGTVEETIPASPALPHRVSLNLNLDDFFIPDGVVVSTDPTYVSDATGRSVERYLCAVVEDSEEASGYENDNTVVSDAVLKIWADGESIGCIS